MLIVHAFCIQLMSSCIFNWIYHFVLLELDWWTRVRDPNFQPGEWQWLFVCLLLPPVDKGKDVTDIFTIILSV